MKLEDDILEDGIEVEPEASSMDKEDVIPDTMLSWAKKVIRDHGGDMPIHPHIAKGAKSRNVHVWVDSAEADAIESMMYQTKHRFDTQSELYRVIIHIGLVLVNEMLCSDGSLEDDTAYKLITQNSLIYKNNEYLRNAIKCAGVIKEAFESGIISAEERDIEVDKVIKTLPKKLHKAAHNKIKQVFAGKKLSELSAFKEKGGTHRSGKIDSVVEEG